MKRTHPLIFVALGIAFWATGVLVVRLGGETIFGENSPWLGLAFVLAVPLLLTSMYLTRLVTRLDWHEFVGPMGIMTFSAVFLDGLVLAWYHPLYAASYEVALHGAAWILWGGGMGLFWAWFFEWRKQAKA